MHSAVDVRAVEDRQSGCLRFSFRRGIWRHMAATLPIAAVPDVYRHGQ